MSSVFYVLEKLVTMMYMMKDSDYTIKDNRYACNDCYDRRGIVISFKDKSGMRKHFKTNHMPHQAKSSVVVSAKSPQPENEITKIMDKMDKMMGELQELKNATKNTAAAPTVVNITHNNNVNIYFNKDLKYYPELVKLIGKKETWDYLLFTMPENKDMFGVIGKLFSSSTNCPIKVDGESFIIVRGESDHVSDTTGELIDKENKTKLKDAVMSAYIDSTKDINDECEKIRLSRINGSYTEADEEVIARRFDGLVEPSRPYEIIEMINSYKLKRRDFDKLRKICPQVTKKTVYDY